MLYTFPMNIGENLGNKIITDGNNPSVIPIPEILAQAALITPLANELQKQARGKEPPYIKVYTKNTVEQFVKRYLLGSVKAQSLVLVSPFLSTLDGEAYSLKDILKRATKDHTRVYIVTRQPEAEYQHAGIELLKQFSCVEIRYNPEIHAKLYVCWGREVEESFAFFGSGNLTSGGLRYNLELGMMILARGDGKNILKALYQWGSFDIRTASTLIKSIS
jgi:HKD family nuclease